MLATLNKWTPVMSFYCSVCNIQFADSHAAESHKASLRHKKRSGEAAREAVLYKKDEEVTVEDVMGLMRRKAQELGLQPWRELRYNPPGEETKP